MPLLYETAKKAASIAESEVAEIADKLRKQVAGEVRMDRYYRQLYATDASIFQMTPVGVVMPRTVDDVEAAVRVAREHGVPVLPRGGGTSLAGQGCNHAIVIDFSKYLRNVLEVSPEERWARVQPGIVNNHLTRAVSLYGLMYGPDPVTSARATIGGGIGNNSCGAHSVIYGKTLDHILEVNAVLSDGTRTHFAPFNGQPLEDKFAAPGIEGAIYREVRRLAHEHRDEIVRRYPRILRRVMGYNLDDFMGDGPMNLARMVVGSEGTLVAVTEAKVNLVPVPTYKGLAVVHFDGIVQASEASVPILEHSPSAVELIGKMILDNCRNNPGYKHLVSYLEGEPTDLLFVEFYGDSEAEVRSKLEALKADMEHRRHGYATIYTTDPATQRFWYSLREAGLGLAMALKGDAKPLPYVEDSAVSPEKLPEYVRRFDEIVRSHDTEAAYYGHASTGCLHIRPVVNLATHEGIEKMVSIAEEIADLVLEFGGSLSGEHGDGIVRGAFTEKMFGSEIYQAFKELKAAFDPDSVMNPGKIIETPGLRENLRISPATKHLEVATHQDFSREGGFARHIEDCNGQGACRKMEGGMCPSFMVTREEEHSTRGRANALRAIVSGILPAGELSGERLQETLDLCVECKACKAECPSNVDMAKLKAEALSKHHEAHGVPLRARAFADIARFSALVQPLAPVVNFMSSLPPVKLMTERVLGISRHRPLPRFARRRFTSWFKRHSAPQESPRGEIVLFNDTFSEYMHPEVGQAATRILEKLGYHVTLVERRVCCGRPAISKGQLGKAKAWARINVDALLPFAQKGIFIVGTEPSCLLTLRDEYPDLLRDDDARTVAAHAFMLDELLAKLAADEPDAVKSIFAAHATSIGLTALAAAATPGTAAAGGGTSPSGTEGPGSTNGVGTVSTNGAATGASHRRLQVHGHCHQKALVTMAPTMKALALAGYRAELIDSGCCGMAGTFGFEKEHYEISKAMGALKLFPAIEAEDRKDWPVAISGISCRQQIGHFTSKRPRHVVEYLADALA